MEIIGKKIRVGQIIKLMKFIKLINLEVGHIEDGFRGKENHHLFQCLFVCERN